MAQVHKPDKPVAQAKTRNEKEEKLVAETTSLTKQINPRTTHREKFIKLFVEGKGFSIPCSVCKRLNQL